MTETETDSNHQDQIETEQDRRTVLTGLINGSPMDVWTAWTTREGLNSFFGKDSRVELRRGGMYEVYFRPDEPAGQKGSEASIVLGWQEEKMLSVAWSMPPYMPGIRPHLTHLTIYLKKISANQTKVTIIHSGFGEGTAWDEAFAKFQESWKYVVERLDERFQDGK